MCFLTFTQMEDKLSGEMVGSDAINGIDDSKIES